LQYVTIFDNLILKGEDMITIKDVEHVAKLARLELTDNEKEMFTHQLGDVLAHVEKMNEVDTTGVEPMNHPLDFSNVMREDVKIYENTREELMQNAPDIEGEFFKVPKIN
jgi:aspartyl-tRNA(Asn)/glutamyl-tRNA(Gln) amidotransferase subunit C